MTLNKVGYGSPMQLLRANPLRLTGALLKHRLTGYPNHTK